MNRSDKAARAVSAVGHPFVVAPAGIVLLLWIDGVDPWEALRWAALCSAIVILPAVLYLRDRLRKRAYTDADVSVREHRFSFYLFGAACMILCVAVLWWGNAPSVLLAGAAAGLAALAAAFAATRFWTKVSIHAGTLAGLTAGLAVHRSLLAGPAGGLLLATCWARLHLDRHTPLQIVLGIAIAVLAVLLVYLPLTGSPTPP